jgi:hypothetical protein
MEEPVGAGTHSVDITVRIDDGERIMVLERHSGPRLGPRRRDVALFGLREIGMVRLFGPSHGPCP